MRSSFFKRLVALGMATAMSVSLVACGAKTEEQPNEVANEEVETGTEEQSTVDDLYGYADPITIKIGITDSSDFTYREGESSENNPWVDLYKEHGFNQEIIYQVDSSQAETKLASAITSGNYPDILLVGGADYIDYAKTGVIADISGLVEEYGSEELKAYLESDGGVGLKSAYVDGKLYGIPLLGNSYDSVMIMFIRQDWLDNLGLKVPTTMEELHEVALAFSKNDPDGNGVNDTYGLALNGKDVFGYYSGVQAFMEGYGAMPGYWDNNFTFVEKDGKISWGGADSEAMKAGLTLLNEMYNDGSIAKDFGVMDGDRIAEEFSAGKCGIMFAPMWGAMNAAANLIKTNLDSHIVAAPIPDGNGEGSAKPWFTSSVAQYYTISSQCKNPEALIKLLNISVDILCHTESDEEFATYIADSQWKCAWTRTMEPMKNLDNFYKESAALESGDISELTTEQKSDYTAMRAYLDEMEKDNPDTESDAVQSGIGLYSVFGDPQGGYAAIAQIKDEGNLNVSAYTSIATDKMTEVYPTLNKLAMETIIKIITGDATVDSYDEFLEDWYKLGGEDVTKEAQEWYDTNN